MSAGGDNALKQWVFDAADGSARLLRFRSGHAAPPTCLAHYGEAGTPLYCQQVGSLSTFS